MSQQISPTQFSLDMTDWLRNGLDEVKKATGKTQDDLAQALGIHRSNVSKMANGKQDIPPHYLATIAAFIGKQPPHLIVPTLDLPSTPRPAPNASFPPRYQKFPDETVPVMGQTVGGPNGKFVLNGQEVARVFCPPDLAGIEGAYAVQVYGTSMEPKFEAGETVWLHPYAPVRSGDYVVAQILSEEGEPPESYIKQFVSQSSKVLRLKQFNPEEGESADMEFDADKVFSVHKIVFHALV